MAVRFAVAVLAFLLAAVPVQAQTVRPSPGSPSAALGPYDQMPSPYEVLGISVEGVESEATRSFILQTSGLQVGQTVTIPGDQVFSDAIKAIYRLGQFSDVQVVEEQRVGNGVYLAIRVQPEPKLADYSFEGVKKGNRKDIQEKLPLLKGMPVRPGDVERSIQVIEEFYNEKGYLLAAVDVERSELEGDRIQLRFDVDRGPRVEVGDVRIEGNEQVSDRKLVGALENTKEDRWWRFWKRETFDRDKFQQDLQALLEYYGEQGFYDARIVSDTTYVESPEGDDPQVIVELHVEEGPRYHIRNIEWEGNTVYTDAFLTESLGFERGDVYNGKKIEENLYANRRSSDVSSLYYNQGYMRFNVQPTIRIVAGDSLDLHFDVFEGDIYEFGEVRITGNTKTKEHVIRRELYTIPGQTFSRDLIQESVRRLSQLNYFNQESLAAGPTVEVNEEKKQVDLTYSLEEAGSDQLELSGTWGSFGLVLMLRFNFNNFSAQNLFNGDAWDPLPAGDGQQFSVAVQTSGTLYQNYSISFTEPWFRGRPTPVGASLSYSQYGGGRSRYGYSRSMFGGGSLETGSARVFYDRRLKWPDDKFNSSTALRYQYYNADSLQSIAIPNGVSHIMTVQQSFTRNSQDHPIFPRSGSLASFSVEVSPPIGGFIQYHKWRFKTAWSVPIIDQLSIGVGTDFGFVGSLTGRPVDFERFIVGGSPFDYQGFYGQFGKDIVYMRGYPAQAIGPLTGGRALGGTILNKYTSELRWMAIQSPQLQAAPYLFMDAANSWNGFSSYNPTQLYRSAGVGMKLFLPIIGMLELTYGYNFDQFVPPDATSGRHTGEQQWYFQFSLGQGFGN